MTGQSPLNMGVRLSHPIRSELYYKEKTSLGLMRATCRILKGSLTIIKLRISKIRMFDVYMQPNKQINNKKDIFQMLAFAWQANFDLGIVIETHISFS